VPLLLTKTCGADTDEDGQQIVAPRVDIAKRVFLCFCIAKIERKWMKNQEPIRAAAN
jgi:hypothetical protein